MKKAILFDLDNTLYPYLPSHETGLKASAAFAASTLHLSAEAFHRLYEESRREIHQSLKGTASSHNRILYFQRIYETCTKKAESANILRCHQIYWKAYFSKMTLFQGVLELFDFLKKRHRPIAIVTDMTTQLQLEKLKVLKLAPYVQALVTSEEAGVEKPHPRIFQLALKKLGILPGEACLVGDDPVADVEGANRVGIETIQWVPNGRAAVPQKEIRKPHHQVSTYHQLKQFLNDSLT